MIQILLFPALIWVKYTPLVGWWSRHIEDSLESRHAARWSPEGKTFENMTSTILKTENVILCDKTAKFYNFRKFTSCSRITENSGFANSGMPCGIRSVPNKILQKTKTIVFNRVFVQVKSFSFLPSKLSTCSRVDCELHFVLLWQGVRNINLCRRINSTWWENIYFQMDLGLTCWCRLFYQGCLLFHSEVTHADRDIVLPITVHLFTRGVFYHLTRGVYHLLG